MKTILLKNLLKEISENDTSSPLKYQTYVDMDGVLVNLDKGFRAVSGGLSPQEYEAKNGKNTFWKIVNQNPNFWLDLEPLPDAKVLWDYIRDNFKDPQPVVLSAGQGNRVVEQKTAWIRKHIDPSVRVIIASSGINKPQYIINPTAPSTTHILLDDTDKNITAWENSGEGRIALLHKNAADSIKLIQSIISK
jgi:hypothetical protein